MRKYYLCIVFIIALISMAGVLYAAPPVNTPASEPPQETVLKNWGLAFTMPSSKWVLVDTQSDPNLRQAVVVYCREPILDSKGIAVIPNITFTYEGLDQEIDLLTYSREMRVRMGDKFGRVKTVFFRDDEPQLISLKNAMGYICEGKDSKEMEHTIIWVHMLNKQIGIQVIMDVSTEVYPAVKGEFEAMLRSLREI